MSHRGDFQSSGATVLAAKRARKSSGRSRVTAWQVAHDADVSQSAVSRAFAGGAGVSAATRDRIFAAAERLGYHPNALARGLSTQRSGIVGVVISQMSNPFLSGALEGLSQKLRAAGLRPFLITVDNEREFGAAMPALEEYRVDGCFVISPHLSRGTALKYGSSDATVLLFNRALPGLNASTVHVDNVAGGRVVADLLADEGHRRIGYLHGARGSATDADRFTGFSGRLAERGLGPPDVGWGDNHYAAGAQACIGLMKGKTPPSALFCANDIMAMGAMDAARNELGLRVPDDLAIVGFDDATTAAWSSYNLTTVRQPVDQMIEAGIELMLAQVSEPGRKPTRRMFEGTLVIRGSTLTPADGATEDRPASGVG